ncbi:MAG: hypothetical protein TREMPRED_005436 [Tremellales sp. Tagirdzhanova-0007]|nr:MAG: hypothetical protein TREMPRED_005436 [Tremellales sp. Tagirdzhanova-0007]
MIKGDLDSLRSDVQTYYSSKGVSVKYDGDQNSTDLMKCIAELEAEENASGKKYSLLLFGGLSGRIDQTVHTMSLLHKLRKTRPDSFVLSGESLAWVLDKGSHIIEIDHATMGETCGILPVGVDEAFVKTEGLKWNLVPSEPVVQVTTDQPILWCVEVKANLPSPSVLVARRSEPLHRPT